MKLPSRMKLIGRVEMPSRECGFQVALPMLQPLESGAEGVCQVGKVATESQTSPIVG